jgi:hypothetical protein
MAKLLAVIALCEAILVFVCLHLDRYVAKACQFRDFPEHLSPGNGYGGKGNVRFFRIF